MVNIFLFCVFLSIRDEMRVGCWHWSYGAGKFVATVIESYTNCCYSILSSTMKDLYHFEMLNTRGLI